MNSRMTVSATFTSLFLLVGVTSGQELVNIKLTSTKRGYDTVTNPPSGAKQDFSIPKSGILTVTHILEPFPAVATNAGGFRMFPIKPKNGPDWEARHHLGTVISSERTPKEPKAGDKVTLKTVYRVLPTPEDISIAVRLAPPLVFQAFQIGNRGEQLGAVQQVVVEFIPVDEYSGKDKAAPQVDISGTWKHGDPFGPNATWTFTPKGPGEYEAVEKGFENSRGTAKVRGRTIYIDHTFTGKDGKPKKGLTVITLDETNKGGSGWFINDLGEGGARIWSATPAKPIPPANPVGKPPAGKPADVTKFTIQVGRRVGKPGEVVDVPVYLLAPGGAASMNVTVSFPPGAAVVSGEIERGNVLGRALFAANSGERGRVRIGVAGTAPLADSGTLAVIPLKLAGKPGDKIDLTVSVTSANGYDGKSLTADTLAGSVTIVEDSPAVPAIPGAADGMAGLRMSVGLVPEDRTADADGDGKVTANDVRLILLKSKKGK